MWSADSKIKRSDASDAINVAQNSSTQPTQPANCQPEQTGMVLESALKSSFSNAQANQISLLTPISSYYSSVDLSADFHAVGIDGFIQSDTVSEILDFGMPDTRPMFADGEEDTDTAFREVGCLYTADAMFQPSSLTTVPTETEISPLKGDSSALGYLNLERVTDYWKTLSQQEGSAARFYLAFVLPNMFPFATPDVRWDISEYLQNMARTSIIGLSAIVGPAMFWKHSQLQQYGLQSWPRCEDTAASHERLCLDWLLQLQTNFEYVGRVVYNETIIEQAQVCATHLLISHVSLHNIPLRPSIRINGAKSQRGCDWTKVLKILAQLPLDGCQDTNPSLRRFQSLLIWIDLLSSIYTGKQPTLALNFQDLFAKGGSLLRLEEVTGCHKDLIPCLMNIILLQNWKTERLLTGVLSMAELVKRGLKLELDLERFLEESRKTVSANSLLSSNDESTWTISNVFASAGLIYLHFTLSGPQPEIPEIRAAVATTIDCLKKLPSFDLLRRLSWPILICACLAESKNRDFFDKLEDGLAEDLEGNKKVYQALAVARECWRSRSLPESTAHLHDWKTAMESFSIMPLII